MKEILKKLNAPNEFIEWVGDMDLKTVWQTCNYGDWMLYLALELEINSRILVLTQGHIANSAIRLMKDERSINTVSVAIKFGQGLATYEELMAASAAAYDAAVALAATTSKPTTNATVLASYAAAYAAADAAHNNAYNTVTHTARAFAAFAATNAIAVNATFSNTFPDLASADAVVAKAAYNSAAERYCKLFADICRKYIPVEEIERALAHWRLKRGLLN